MRLKLSIFEPACTRPAPINVCLRITTTKFGNLWPLDKQSVLGDKHHFSFSERRNFHHKHRFEENCFPYFRIRMVYQLKVNFVGIYSANVLLLVIYLCAWSDYQKRDGSSRDCLCSCSDDTMKSSNLVTKVEYTGTSLNGSCLCEDFLVPLLTENWMPSNVSVACGICTCGKINKLDCEDGKISFSAMNSIVCFTLVFVCSLMWCDIVIRAWRRKLHSSKRQGNHVQLRKDPLDKLCEYFERNAGEGKSWEKILENYRIKAAYQTF